MLTMKEIEKALETVDLCNQYCMCLCDHSEELKTIKEALEMAKANVWQPIDDWCEERGDVAIVLFTNEDHLLYCTLFTTPLSSDFPDLEEHGLYGYFKTVDMSDLYPTPPQKGQNDE